MLMGGVALLHENQAGTVQTAVLHERKNQLDWLACSARALFWSHQAAMGTEPFAVLCGTVTTTGQAV
jgi:hypothetical protein